MSLKSIASLIKAGDYDQAENEILAIEKAGKANTVIYLCGLRCATEKGQYNNAIKYLQKVKELDPKNPEVIKAECSVYEKFPEKITKDNLAFLDKVIGDEKISDAKKKTLKKLKWCALIRLGLIGDFCVLDDNSEAMEDIEICGLIMNALTLGKKFPLVVSRAAFINSKDQLPQKEHLNGTLLFQNQPEFDAFAFEHALKFGCSDSTIAKNVYTRIAYELLKEGKLSPSLAEAVKVKDFVQQVKPTAEWLTNLFANEIAQAYDCLLKLSPEDYNSWPMCGLAFFTFFVTRQYDEVIKLYRSMINAFPDDNIFKVLEFEALFENHADETELKYILRTIENSSVKDVQKVIEIKLRIKILLCICDDEEIKDADLETATKHELLAELYFASKDYSSAAHFADLCIKLKVNNPWRCQLILAKMKWIVDDNFDEAEFDLRELYSANPFIADIVATMAEFYVALEEWESAKTMIDHAILLNSSNRGLRELQDNIYSILEMPIEDRIRNLNAYITLKPYSMWAVKHVTVLELKCGKFEEAINKLRRVIHALPDDVDVEVKKNAGTIWSYVGLVNFRRGHSRSAMYAFESAVSLDPDNPNFLIQLALTQKKLYKFEEVFATLKKLRSVKCSPEISKYAHSLFLQSLSSYASQLKPGERQLRQLLTLFKNLGAISAAEWSTSGALLLSVSNGLALLRKYNKNDVDEFIQLIPAFAKNCNITKKDDILDAEIAIMYELISIEQNVGALIEVGIRLLTYAKQMESLNLAEISRRFFKKAILSCGQKADVRSILYLNFGVTFLIGGTVNFENALHCFFRSLQLKKANPSALSLIGLVYINMKNIGNAIHAFRNAHILEPTQLEHWCARALIAELQNDETEAMNLFQHSLIIKPCPQAIEAFCYYLVKRKAAGCQLNKFECDFAAVRHLLYVTEPSDPFLYSMAICAEHFRHFDEAAYLLSKVSPNFTYPEATLLRIVSALEKPSTPPTTFPDNNLERLHKIYHGTLADAVAASGLQSNCLLVFLLDSVAYNDWQLFWKFYRAKLYPLLVGLVNALEMDSSWSRGILLTLRTTMPLHKFLQVFPCETPRRYFSTAFRPRGDDKSFEIFDPCVQSLFDLLLCVKTKYDSENGDSVEDAVFIHYNVQLDESFSNFPEDYDETESMVSALS